MASKTLFPKIADSPTKSILRMRKGVCPSLEHTPFWLSENFTQQSKQDGGQSGLF